MYNNRILKKHSNSELYRRRIAGYIIFKKICCNIVTVLEGLGAKGRYVFNGYYSQNLFVFGD